MFITIIIIVIISIIIIIIVTISTNYVYSYVLVWITLPWNPWTPCTVSFHNFKSQKEKLSVSNPKSKYVAHLSVLSQFSNCQGLDRKNKHEILKTDRTIHAQNPSSKRNPLKSLNALYVLPWNPWAPASRSGPGHALYNKRAYNIVQTTTPYVLPWNPWAPASRSRPGHVLTIPWNPWAPCTVSFHNFKSRNFKFWKLTVQGVQGFQGSVIHTNTYEYT